MTASKDGIILKFRLVNCLCISPLLKQLSNASVQSRSQEYLFGNFSANYHQGICGRIYIK